MTNKLTLIGTATLLIVSMALAAPAEARHHYRHYRQARADSGHGNCLRFDKTTGTVAGAVGGGLLGRVIAGHNDRAAGTLIGAAGGGIAGHELARNGRKNCR